MKEQPTRAEAPAWIATVEIEPEFRDRRAIIAALLAAGHKAIELICAGAAWEDEGRMALAPQARAHAGRMALLWQRTARHLQHQAQRPRP